MSSAAVFVGGATQFRGMDPQTDRLAELVAADGFTAVVYDRRGASGDTPPWSIEREVDDVAALIAEIGGQAALYSSWSGAAVALAAATASVRRGGSGRPRPPRSAGTDRIRPPARRGVRWAA